MWYNKDTGIFMPRRCADSEIGVKIVWRLLVVALLSLTSCSRVGKSRSIATTTTTVTTSRMTTTAQTQTTVPATEPPYLIEDAILMAQVINKESSATYEGRLAVASVIVNRSEYSKLTIPEVVFEPNQFSVVGDLGSYTELDYKAAVEVLTNGSVNNAYYFDGCHEDGLNHFRDIDNNYIGAW